MGSMSAMHWLIVLIIVLLVFGPKRLSSLGKGLGEGIRSFREGIAGDGETTPGEKAIQKDKPGEKTPSAPS
jgi:sec-independent protein translocase protein TatA